MQYSPPASLPRRNQRSDKKAGAIAGKNDAGKLQRQVYVAGRIKTENESIYYNIDAIHRAIQENRQITFVYLDWNLPKGTGAQTRWG